LKPGIIDSGEGLMINHNCNLDRSVVYYLEVVCVLAIFGKTVCNLTLNGNTDDD
jgi:hypothetical protein